MAVLGVLTFVFVETEPEVTVVTYGGVAMTEVPVGTDCKAWFLSSSVLPESGA